MKPGTIIEIGKKPVYVFGVECESNKDYWLKIIYEDLSRQKIFITDSNVLVLTRDKFKPKCINFESVLKSLEQDFFAKINLEWFCTFGGKQYVWLPDGPLYDSDFQFQTETSSAMQDSTIEAFASDAKKSIDYVRNACKMATKGSVPKYDFFMLDGEPYFLIDYGVDSYFCLDSNLTGCVLDETGKESTTKEVFKYACIRNGRSESEVMNLLSTYL